jgi:hypothetical protein
MWSCGCTSHSLSSFPFNSDQAELVRLYDQRRKLSSDFKSQSQAPRGLLVADTSRHACLQAKQSYDRYSAAVSCHNSLMNLTVGLSDVLATVMLYHTGSQT